jgi:hypothetical protein
MPDTPETAGAPGVVAAPCAENGRLRMLLEDKDAQIAVFTAIRDALAGSPWIPPIAAST